MPELLVTWLNKSVEDPSNKLVWHWYSFTHLSSEQLYAVLSLRVAVFVVEQKCPYQDPDYQDQKALHLLGREGDQLVAYLRLFPPTEEKKIIFGRVLTSESVRKKGYGKELMKELFSYCKKHYPNMSIECSAQLYLKKFYESFGFKTVGEVYEEDEIPHIWMKGET